MVEETEGQSSLKQEFFDTKLSVEGLTRLAEQLGKVVSEPIGDDLIRVVEQGTPPNWQRTIELADIVFGSEIRTLDQEGRKPWQYLIEITAAGKTEEMNARMVGQITQQFVSFAELLRNAQQLGGDEKSKVLNDAKEAIALHCQTAMWKNGRKKVIIEGQSLKSMAEASGVTFVQGLDGAGLEQLLHIMKAIKERADDATPEMLRDNNQQVREKVKRLSLQE
ncbi:hypothetical protein ACFLZ1_02935 [Patescibacteria group bacterium]